MHPGDGGRGEAGDEQHAACRRDGAGGLIT